MRSRFDLPRGGGGPPSAHSAREFPVAPSSAAAVLPGIPNDPRRWRDVLLALLEQHNWAHGRKAKGVSHKTIHERREFLFRFFRELRLDPDVQYRLDPRSLGGRHVAHAVQRWVERGLSAATIQTYLSHLRVFADWIGKPGMVEGPAAYVSDPAVVQRTYSAQTDRGWSASGVDLVEVLVRIDTVDLRVGAQLRMCGAFGLRVRESIMCRPHQAELERAVVLSRIRYQLPPDIDRFLEVSRGTKGGRQRFVPIDSDLKRAVLGYARQVVHHPHENLGHPSFTLKQAYHRFFNVMRTCGVTRSELGITAHGLRHEYANDLYESVAGVAAPLRGGEPTDADTDDAARMRVVRDLGHGRKSISSAYLGGLMRQGRLKLDPIDPVDPKEAA